MYENMEVEDIKSDIISNIKTDIDVREGSFTNDMISATAYEIWKMYQSLDAILPMIYIDETSGIYIDKRCAEYGITRKSGTKATAQLTFNGTNGIVIPKGKVFLTNEGLEFILDNDITIFGGAATGTATAQEVGDSYNVAADTIKRQFVNQSGISTVSNTLAAGGNNQETDQALLARLYNFMQKPATSGNANQYRQWALDVTGIGEAKVFPLWNGPGTVKVVIVDSEKQPVTVTMVNNVKEYIESVRPIGATITVVSGTGKIINNKAKLTIASGYTLQQISNLFKEAIKEYLKNTAFKSSYISYAKIGTILLGIDGVVDYSNLLINGGTANILLSEEEVPTLGIVELEV